MQSGNSQCDVQSTASEGLNGHSEKVDDSQSDSNSEEISALPPIDDVSSFFFKFFFDDMSKVTIQSSLAFLIRVECVR